MLDVEAVVTTALLPELNAGPFILLYLFSPLGDLQTVAADDRGEVTTSVLTLRFEVCDVVVTARSAVARSAVALVVLLIFGVTSTSSSKAPSATPTPSTGSYEGLSLKKLAFNLLRLPARTPVPTVSRLPFAVFTLPPPEPPFVAHPSFVAWTVDPVSPGLGGVVGLASSGGRRAPWVEVGGDGGGRLVFEGREREGADRGEADGLWRGGEVSSAAEEVDRQGPMCSDLAGKRGY
jgi:hypothetical protein